jgi:hypothetical protein
LLKQMFDEQATRLETRLETRLFARLDARLVEHEIRLSEQLGHVVRVVMEDVMRQFGLFEDKYKDPPPRVQKLENDATTRTCREARGRRLSAEAAAVSPRALIRTRQRRRRGLATDGV